MYTLKRSGWLVAASLILVIGCKKSTDSVSPANSECQLQSTTTVYSDGDKSASTYTYNGNGQLVSNAVSSSTNGTSTGAPATNTFAYDGSGNLITATIQQSSGTSTLTYEYSGGRLSKETTQVAGTTQSLKTYSYDGSGQIAAYVLTQYSGSQSIKSSYTFTSGLLTGATITSGSLSATVAVSSGRITSITYPNGSRYRWTYDSNGYATRVDELTAAGVVEYYTLYEYGTTSFKQANIPPVNAPAINLYGNTGLPVTRQVAYNGDGTKDEEYALQYQINSKGYLTSTALTYNSTSYGKYTGTVTNTYSNCQ